MNWALKLDKKCGNHLGNIGFQLQAWRMAGMNVLASWLWVEQNNISIVKR